MKVSVRCDQNRIFGCGSRSLIPATMYVIGKDRVRVMGGGNCSSCSLPLALVRDATPDERASYFGHDAACCPICGTTTVCAEPQVCIDSLGTYSPLLDD